MPEITDITQPVVGDPTEIDAFAQPVINNVNELAARSDSTLAEVIVNGSFEVGTGADTAPPGWALDIAEGNDTDFEESAANTRHGRKAFRMSTPGSIVGGVTLSSSIFMLAAEER